MEKPSEPIIISGPHTLRELYPQAGWTDGKGNTLEIPEDPEIELPERIGEISRLVVEQVEATIKAGLETPEMVVVKRPQFTPFARSITFEVELKMPEGKQHNSRDARELYKRAGWSSVEITKKWRNKNRGTHDFRLTKWLELANIKTK